jgi:general secretion pathway protein I
MMRRQHGLTMVEVLAAMVIFSSGAVVLFGWISQTAQRLALVNREQAQLFGELAALEYLRSLNPTRRPTGDETIGEARVRWQSTPVGSEQATRLPSGAEGIYVVRLYEVQVTVDAAEAGRTERSLWLPGWRQIRPGAATLPFNLGGQPEPTLPAVAPPAAAVPSQTPPPTR